LTLKLGDLLRRCVGLLYDCLGLADGLVLPLRRRKLDRAVSDVLPIKLPHGLNIVVDLHQAHEPEALALLCLLVPDDLALSERRILRECAAQNLLVDLIPKVAAVDSEIIVRPIGKT